MFKGLTWDDSDPISRSYRRYLLLLKKLVVIFVAFALLALMVGMPHFQVAEYRYYGPRKASQAFLPAQRKVEAWYLSVTGWKEIKSGQYGQNGCPFLLFVPVRDCFGS